MQMEYFISKKQELLDRVDRTLLMIISFYSQFPLQCFSPCDLKPFINSNIKT